MYHRQILHLGTYMSDILYNLIKDNAYKSQEIQEVSFNSQDKTTNWLFDFKGLGLSKSFLQEYAKRFWNVFKDRYGSDLQIGGMETGAIPLIAGISLCENAERDVANFYIRKSRKKSDLANLIEGEVRQDIPIILVDDILNRGRTIKKQVLILEELGHKVSAVFVCLRFRDMSYYKELTEKGIEIFSIYELDDFSRILPVQNLKEETRARLPVKYSAEYKVTLTTKPNLYLVLPKSAPLLVGDYIYMGADDGSFFCLRADTGDVVWTYKVLFGAHGKRIFSSPAVYKDKVIFGAYDGNVYCLDRFSGKRAWVFVDADWVGSSPCVEERRGIVFVGLEFGLINKRGGIVAIDMGTGNAIWKNYAMAGLTHASPAYNEEHNLVVCGCNDNYVYALDAGTGEIRWKFETQAEIKYGAVFDMERNLVVCASLDGGVYVLNTKDGSLYHRFEAQFGFYSTPVLIDGLIIIGSLDKHVYCFNVETKKVIWSFETAGRIFASPAYDRGNVFIGSNDGRLYEFETRSGALVSSIQLTERIVNKIQIGRARDGKRQLYIPTHVCELYKMNEQ